MNPGISIQIIWPLAAQEAISKEYERIEPLHLLLGILKFGELENHQIERLTNESELSILLPERDKVRSILHGFSVKVPDQSRGIRYSIREHLVHGRHPYDGKAIIHRSHKSREICSKAEAIAQIKKKLRWEAVDLLEASLFPPHPEIMAFFETCPGVAAFFRNKESSAPEKNNNSNIDRYTIDHSAIARKNDALSHQENENKIKQDPVCRVVIELMQKNNLLLVQAGRRTSTEIVKTVVQFLLMPPPQDVNQTRIVELKFTETEEIEKIIQLVVHEIQNSKNVLLYLNDFHRFLKIPILKSLLSGSAIKCIAGIDEANYQKHIAKDNQWKKLFKSVWIHDVGIPSRL